MKKEFLITEKQFHVTSPAPLIADDANCYELVFYAPCDLTGCAFTVTATRADGKSFTGLGNVSGKTARYTFENSMYAVEGTLEVRTTITTKDGEVLTTNEITFNVLKGTSNNEAVEAETSYPILTQLIMKVEGFTEEAPELIERATNAARRAENAADSAETHGMYAEIQAENAESAANSASFQANRARVLLDEVEAASDALPPDFSADDEGKILYLSKNASVCDMQEFSESYTEDDNVISDAGLLDEDTAFIDINGIELNQHGVSDPLDDRCMFAFQLMPDSSDYATDYDVLIDEVQETDDGYRMIFRAESCEPFAENNIQSASDLFNYFEGVQFSAEFPVAVATPVWGTPSDILPGAFLDENIISPAVALAKEYTDESTSFTVTVRDSEYSPGNPVTLDGITRGVKRIELNILFDTASNPTTLSLYYMPHDGTIEQFVTQYALPDMKTGDRIVFNVPENKALIYESSAPDVPIAVSDAETFIKALKSEDFNTIVINDLQAMWHNVEIEYYVSAEYMVDDKIKSAINDSWEAAV